MDSTLLTAESWITLCWQGAINGMPDKVLDACDKAVNAATTEKRWMFQDSRGIARALTGNSQTRCHRRF